MIKIFKVNSIFINYKILSILNFWFALNEYKRNSPEIK